MERRHFWRSSAPLSLYVFPVAGATASPSPGTVTVEAYRAESAPSIDGRLGESEWAGASVFSAFVQQQPRKNEPSAELSSANVRFAWLTRSGTGLFVVFDERRDFFLPGSEPLGRSFIAKYPDRFEL